MLFLFSSSALIELIYLALFALTIRLPGFQFWPPPSHRSWQFFTAWLLASYVAVGFFFVGLLDYNSAFLQSWMRFPAGLLLHLIGSVFGSWSMKTIGFRATIGLGEVLITDGPYRFSRNPQYLSDMLHIAGFMLLVNSWMTWIIGVLGIILNLLAPFTEEPWLEEKFGDAYREYKANVPRFL